MLPIKDYKKEIIKAVCGNSVTIISAETGTGKSTQVPQYLVDYFKQVIVTEPRVIAAKTLAQRVSIEMDTTVGEVVGYRTAYDKCFSENSRIIYCTDGVQLIRSFFNEDTQTKRVLIIDEVHEWNLNIETLIAWCKMMQGKWNTKVVLMSATIDSVRLAEFFEGNVAVVDIPETLYDVTVEERPAADFIPAIKECISKNKDVLVFVPGKMEISKVMAELEQENATVLPLHSELEWDEQRKCFQKYTNPKVIVATNIAQISITPDIDVVVDTGKARISIAENGIQGLFIKEISISDIKQRKGRAGRTKDGKYILCSDFNMNSRSEYSIPEIQRSILDRVVLQILAIGLNVEDLRFYHQPDINAIKEAKDELIALGALNSDNTVTKLGYKMVRIPVSVQLARMIVEAEKYGVTSAVMTIASIIEIGGLLSKDGQYKDFTNERNSDLLAELDVWNSLKKMGNINFTELKIKRNNFFRIKEHIRKLRYVLDGIVEIRRGSYNRKAILKSCLSGWVSHVYFREWHDEYIGPDGATRYLNKGSCLSDPRNVQPLAIIGKPCTIELKGDEQGNKTLDLICFASRVDESTLKELIPSAITEDVELKYLSDKDAVEVKKQCFFYGIKLGTAETYIDYNNQKYALLKSKYEEDLSYRASLIKE